MLNGQKIVVVMPAYNAAKTLRWTYQDIPHDIVDEVILVDDVSQDETVALARTLGIECFVHPRNAGYGANQKTCYRKAMERGADVVIMLHPDYQYTPKLITAMAAMITSGLYHAVLGSRVLGRGARAGGMPLYKYVANRILTLIQNLCLTQKLTEYHTGYRAFSREVLEVLPLEANSDDFVFDNQMIVQLVYFGYEVAEITCPAKYFEEASSINWWRSVRYGIGVLATTLHYVLARAGFTPRPFLRRAIEPARTATFSHSAPASWIDAQPGGQDGRGEVPR
jgi:glycosyltransferase involved in cell wall biosynthesis